MKVITTFLILLLAAGVLGCGKQLEPRHIVILPDVSGSIERRSLNQAFKAIDELVGHLQRGDRIAIIPILGDAQAEAPGRIIRFLIPTDRKAYDSDLRYFREKLRVSLNEMESNALKWPGTKTDLLGSIGLAQQEFAFDGPQSRPLLIIFSDFIQEDITIDFKKDGRLHDRPSALQLADRMATVNSPDFRGTEVSLGLLRSTEYISIAKSRRSAIEEFWIEYFRCSKAHVTFAADGAGILGDKILAK